MFGARKEIQPHVLKGLRTGLWCAVIAWVAIVSFSLNWSSLGMWDQALPQVDKGHILVGEPKGIRSDEWLVSSPIMLAYAQHYWSGSQGIADFAGPAGSELLMNQPAPHAITLFRPQFWGFFILPKDRGFAFFYATKVIGLALAFFCTTLLLCESSLIALGATTWLLLSSFFQWWLSICLPEMVACGLLSALAAWTLLYTRSSRIVAAAAITLLVSLVDFSMCFYPPFMVPMIHGTIAIGLALVLKYGVIEGKILRSRVLMVASTFVAFGGIMFLVFRDIAPIINLVQNTDYPGRRVADAGSVPGYRYLNNFADVFFSQGRFPVWLGNVCEAAGFILVWPLVIPILAYRWCRKAVSSRDALVFLPLIAVLLGHIAWMSLPVPQWFGSVTGLFLAPGTRTYVGQGVLGILVVAMLTALHPLRSISAKSVALMGVVILVAAFILGSAIERSMPGFLSSTEITLLGLSLGAAAGGLIFAQPIVFWPAILALVIPNALVNPIAHGVRPLVERKLVSLAAKVGRQDPNGRWAVFGDGAYANLLKVAGVRLFNGVVYAPRMDDYKAFDPEGLNRGAYNRYAHFGLEANTSPDQKATFLVVQGDSFVMKVHPCDPAFEKVGVNYFVFTYEPKRHEKACLEPLASGRVGDRFMVFKRTAMQQQASAP